LKIERNPKYHGLQNAIATDLRSERPQKSRLITLSQTLVKFRHQNARIRVLPKQKKKIQFSKIKGSKRLVKNLALFKNGKKKWVPVPKRKQGEKSIKTLLKFAGGDRAKKKERKKEMRKTPTLRKTCIPIRSEKI